MGLVPSARIPATLIVCAVFAGCNGSSDASADSAPAVDSRPLGPLPTDLIWPSNWQRVLGADDPFAKLRPPNTPCDETGFYVEKAPEEQWLDIDTGLCNYLSLGQPSLQPMESNAQLEITAHHFDLTTPDPGEAYLALAINGEIVWEKRVSIPAESAVIRQEFMVPTAAAAGTPIVFHINNHGRNTWQLFSIRLAGGGSGPKEG